MNALTSTAIPVIAATLALALLAVRLHVLGARRLDALERRLEAAAAERVTVLATTLSETLGEELGVQHRANEALSDAFARLGREVERLGADVVNRELYRGDNPRHGDAIDAVRHGGDVASLVREHGLPLEEAELLVSLYAGAGGGSSNRAGARSEEVL